jgi:transposase
LAQSSHAPADWIVHAQLVAGSWDGRHSRHLAEELGCPPQTVRERLHACNDRGLAGLGMPPGSGRKPRLTPLDRRMILALVTLPPPGQPT